MLRAKIITNKSRIDFKNFPSGELDKSCCTKNSKATIDKNAIIKVIIVM